MILIIGGALGVCLAKLFGFFADFPEEKAVLRYAAELNLFVLAVLPLFYIITE